jgi:hypothetical protein
VFWCAGALPVAVSAAFMSVLGIGLQAAAEAKGAYFTARQALRQAAALYIEADRRRWSRFVIGMTATCDFEKII